MDRSQLPARSKALPADVRDQASGTVLVGEDENLLRRVVSNVFRSEGLTVIEAADGESAIESFRAHLSGIDVVLLDMTLPAMSGQQVFQELRRLRPDIKVALTTAYSEDLEVMNAATEKPWRVFIRIPYKLAELSALLKSVCFA